jgi:hypothetical protein
MVISRVSNPSSFALGIIQRSFSEKFSVQMNEETPNRNIAILPFYQVAEKRSQHVILLPQRGRRICLSVISIPPCGTRFFVAFGSSE